jgi:hypothetical protein
MAAAGHGDDALPSLLVLGMFFAGMAESEAFPVSFADMDEELGQRR